MKGNKTMKKPTLATLKAFIRRESKNNNLYIKTKDRILEVYDIKIPNDFNSIAKWLEYHRLLEINIKGLARNKKIILK